MNKLLTIAIPTYNRATYLQECLNPLIKQIEEQRYDCVEIVISDNGSIDDTANVVSKYMERYPYIHYVRFDTNQGFDRNVRSCVENSHGKYVHILSDDDVVSGNYLKEIFTVLDKNPDFVALPSKGFSLEVDDIDENDGVGFSFYNQEDLEFDSQKIIEFISMISYWFTYVSGFIINRELAIRADDSILDTEDGSWFGHIPYYFACLSYGAKYIVASTRVFVNGRVNNFAHYNIYEVFLSKFKKTLYDCCKYFKLTKKIARICYSKMLRFHIPSFEYRIRIGAINTFKTKPKFRYVFKTLLYYNSWRYFIPVVLCPKWILKKRYYRRNQK